jgi:hypothetical protein
VTYPQVSRSMMENKVKHIISSGADTVVTCEPGCLMNVAGGLHKAGSSIRAMHIIVAAVHLTSDNHFKTPPHIANCPAIELFIPYVLAFLEAHRGANS